MNIERLFRLVVMELTTENLRLEEDLENAINSISSAKEKTTKIQRIIERMTVNDSSLNKVSTIIKNIEDSVAKANSNQNENGTNQ